MNIFGESRITSAFDYAGYVFVLFALVVAAVWLAYDSLIG
mgnify:CR=1 FL=1